MFATVNSFMLKLLSKNSLNVIDSAIISDRLTK